MCAYVVGMGLQWDGSKKTLSPSNLGSRFMTCVSSLPWPFLPLFLILKISEQGIGSVLCRNKSLKFRLVRYIAIIHSILLLGQLSKTLKTLKPLVENA